MPSLFEKIIAGELPATVAYRDRPPSNRLSRPSRPAGAGAYTHRAEQPIPTSDDIADEE